MTGRIARIQFNSTLKRKVNTKALKGIFGTKVDKQYIKVKFCAIPHASLKKSLLFV